MWPGIRTKWAGISTKWAGIRYKVRLHAIERRVKIPRLQEKTIDISLCGHITNNSSESPSPSSWEPPS